MLSSTVPTKKLLLQGNYFYLRVMKFPLIATVVREKFKVQDPIPTAEKRSINPLTNLKTISHELPDSN